MATRALDRAEVAQRVSTGSVVRGNRVRATARFEPAVGSGRAALGSSRGRRGGVETSQVGLRVLHPDGRLNDRVQAEVIITAALPDLSGEAWAKTRRVLLRREASRSWIRCKGVWQGWAWTPTCCRRCWTWKVSVASPGVCRRPHGSGRWFARPN